MKNFSDDDQSLTDNSGQILKLVVKLIINFTEVTIEEQKDQCITCKDMASLSKS